MHDHLHQRLTDWFPLLPRPRPASRPLRVRVTEVEQLAHAAAHLPADRLVSAAEAHNKAALVLSDCGLGESARQLCWQQFDLFHAHAPLESATGKLALQPLVNLGRLHIRSGHGARAHELFTNAYRGLRTKTASTIDDRNVDLNELVDGVDGRRELVRFLWTVVLADGTRALTRARRWSDALAHIEQHKGLGDRLLDGRQVAIITRLVRGDDDQALDLLEHSAAPEPWEKAIAAYLRTLCLTAAGRDARTSATGMVERYQELTAHPTPPVFRTRLGLALLDLTDHAPIAADLTREATASADAVIAADVLDHPSCMQSMTEADRKALTQVIATAGLHQGTATPSDIRSDLMDAVASSEAILERELTRHGAVTGSSW